MTRLLNTPRFLFGVLKMNRLWTFHNSHKIATKSPTSSHDKFFLASIKQSSGQRNRELHDSGWSSLPSHMLVAKGHSKRVCNSVSSGCPHIVHCILKSEILIAIFPHEVPLQRSQVKSFIRGGLRGPRWTAIAEYHAMMTRPLHWSIPSQSSEYRFSCFSAETETHEMGKALCLVA
ncbi:hypothetical protein Cgig2_002880 [Carnegiea gigantea]|uniref:Uncharacterized protein n=1 Tax=Carnegiea gigantea TaxID=171969 RepID=A0A9Q1KPW7_9CARY|nr:hypothetical protein Cgig2_002880 [Carnegiea gigantea]